MQPGAEACAFFEPVELPIRLEKRFLDDVLGILGAAGNAESDLVDTAAMALDQQAKGLGVAAAGPGDRSGVGFRHLPDFDGTYGWAVSLLCGPAVFLCTEQFPGISGVRLSNA